MKARASDGGEGESRAAARRVNHERMCVRVHPRPHTPDSRAACELACACWHRVHSIGRVSVITGRAEAGGGARTTEQLRQCCRAEWCLGSDVERGAVRKAPGAASTLTTRPSGGSSGEGTLCIRHRSRCRGRTTAAAIDCHGRRLAVRARAEVGWSTMAEEGRQVHAEQSGQRAAKLDRRSDIAVGCRLMAHLRCPVTRRGRGAVLIAWPRELRPQTLAKWEGRARQCLAAMVLQPPVLGVEQRARLGVDVGVEEIKALSLPIDQHTLCDALRKDREDAAHLRGSRRGAWRRGVAGGLAEGRGWGRALQAQPV